VYNWDNSKEEKGCARRHLRKREVLPVERIPQATPIRTAASNIYRRLQVCAVWVKQWLRREHSGQNYPLRARANRFFVVPTPVCFESENWRNCSVLQRARLQRESSYDFDPPFVMHRQPSCLVQLIAFALSFDREFMTKELLGAA
jgi:hypothetical protein